MPAGSVAIADEFTGVYPRATPGGWRLLGRTDVALFDLDRQPPALLTPGTTGPVRAAMIEVLATGPLATVQDLGRLGYQQLGVARSGAADLRAHRLANRLVGNGENGRDHRDHRRRAGGPAARRGNHRAHRRTVRGRAGLAGRAHPAGRPSAGAGCRRDRACAATWRYAAG